MGNGFRNLRYNFTTSRTRHAQFSDENARLLMASRYLNPELDPTDNTPPQVTLPVQNTPILPPLTFQILPNIFFPSSKLPLSFLAPFLLSPSLPPSPSLSWLQYATLISCDGVWKHFTATCLFTLIKWCRTPLHHSPTPILASLFFPFFVALMEWVQN